MLRRTVLLTFTLAAVFAVIGVSGASAGKPSFSFGFILPPLPAISGFSDISTSAPIQMWCKAQELSGGFAIHCNNSSKSCGTLCVPWFNPDPPKDEKIFRLSRALKDVKLPGWLSGLNKIELWFKLWPSGAVTADISNKGL